MRFLKQSTAANIMVFMTDAADHVTGKASLTLTITASKDGAAFSSISPTVTDRGNGWYSLALSSGNTDTLGDLALHVTGSGADPSDLACRIVAGALDGDISNVQSRLPAALVSGRIDASVGSMAANVMTAAAAAADLTTELQAGLALSTQVDALEGDTATLLARLTTTRAANLDNLDAAISTRAATGASMALTAGAVDAIWDEVIELAYTARQLMRLYAAASGGKASGLDTNVPKYRDLGDTKNRIDATTDATGNRSAVTLDLT